MSAPIRLPAITVYGRLPHKVFPPYKPVIPPIKAYKPAPSHGIGNIPGKLPENRPGQRNNFPGVGYRVNTGFDANKAAIERARQQEEINKRNREEANRRNAQITQNFLNLRQLERQRQLDETNRQRLGRQLREQQQHRNSFIKNFYDLQWKYRNVKPYQWGLGAAAITAAGGILFVDGVAVGITAGLSRLGTSLAGGTAVTKKIIIDDWGTWQKNWYRLWHLLDHAEGIGKPWKSKFPMGTDILKIIAAAEKELPILQGNGNLARYVNVQGIGTVTVITDSFNRLISLFPGFSFKK